MTISDGDHKDTLHPSLGDIVPSEFAGAFIDSFSSALSAARSCFFIFCFRALFLSFLPLSPIAFLLLLLSCSGFTSRSEKEPNGEQDRAANGTSNLA
jgi:hypothetical protein